MPLRLHTKLPSLEGITQWLNGGPNFEESQGKPVLVYFWAVSCHVCHNNMPTLQTIRQEYIPKGLKMIAIHCPRMKTDTDLEKVEAAVEKYGITEPCGIDIMHKAKKSFENEFWPAYYLFDRYGFLKRRSAGNAGLSMVKPLIEKMFEK